MCLEFDVHGYALQSFLSRTCVKTTNPRFEAENNMVLTRDGAHILHVLVHRVKYLDIFRHDVVGFASLDLLQFFEAASRAAILQPGARSSACQTFLYLPIVYRWNTWIVKFNICSI